VPNLEPLSVWLGEDARLGGSLKGNLAITGTGRDPSFAGEVRAANLRVREPANGFEIDQGDVALRIRNQSVTIERFAATTPWHPSEGALAKIGGANRPAGGKITAEGGVDLKAKTGAIRIRAESVPVTQLATRFVAISGEAQLEAKAEGMVVTGALKADAAWIGALATPLPSVSEDVVVVRAAKPKDEEALPKARDRTRLDLRITLGDHVYFQGRGLDTRLAGNLRIAGDTGALRATGSIRTVDGTYDGYGQQLAIERGTLTFAGPIDNPTLAVMALRTGLPVEAGVEVYGTATRPRVRLVSRPDVPEPEKLSWLVLGRGPAEANQGDASTLMAAARAMLGTGAPGGDFVKRFGFDEVRIGRPDAASALGALPQSTVAGKTRSASAADVVTVGKRITRDIHVIYEQGLADAEGALRITWQITRQFQLLLRAGYLPGVDAVYRWSFY
jgi:translocation and assembly module TamB